MIIIRVGHKRKFLPCCGALRSFAFSHPTNLNVYFASSPSSSSAAAEVEKKKYILSMFPYPSGRLHLGHLRVYTLSDVLSRYYALNGYNKVIHPIGWDAFGLPAENAARERGVDPAEWTEKNIEEMRAQLAKTSIRFDWNREIFTCRPEYFRWTQWLFLQLYKHGFVKRAVSEVNWDPMDGTVLADEQIDENGCSWRSGAAVEKRRLRQWAVDTPRFAKRLLDGLAPMEFNWRGVVGIQSDWIGACDVYRFLLPIKRTSPTSDQSSSIDHLDLRLADPSNFGAAQFVVVEQIHPIAREAAELGKTMENGEKFVILEHSVPNFVTGQPMPIVVVNAQSAKANELILGARLGLSSSSESIDVNIAEKLCLEKGIMPINSEEVLLLAEKNGFGGYRTSRTLRDWVVSRQRGWGTPIPMLLNENGGMEPVPEDLLPVLSNQRGKPMGSTMNISSGTVEMDTLDTYFDSSWYFLRFLDPHNGKALFDRRIAWKELPVDVYVGGMEHAKMHLFYARFISHFLHSLDLLPHPEPFARFIPLGVVKAPTYKLPSGQYIPGEEVDGERSKLQFISDLTHRPSGQRVTMEFEKMSKSKKNGVDLMEVIDKHGIDLVRLNLLFEARPSKPIEWPYPFPSHQLKALKKHLQRLESLVNAYVEGRKNSSGSTEALDEQAKTFCEQSYNKSVKRIRIYLEVLHFHNMSVINWFDFVKNVNEIVKKNPALAGHSIEFERCVHAIIVMGQIFVPDLADKYWKKLAEVPKLSTQFRWKPESPVNAQKWPESGEDGNTELLILIFGTLVRGIAPLQEIDELDDKQLEMYIRQKSHRRFFELLEERQHPIKETRLERFPGLCYVLHLEMPDNVRKSKVIRIINTISMERKKQQKEASQSGSELEEDEKEQKTVATNH